MDGQAGRLADTVLVDGWASGKAGRHNQPSSTNTPREVTEAPKAMKVERKAMEVEKNHDDMSNTFGRWIYVNEEFAPVVHSREMRMVMYQIHQETLKFLEREREKKREEPVEVIHRQLRQLRVNEVNEAPPI